MPPVQSIDPFLRLETTQTIDLVGSGSQVGLGSSAVNLRAFSDRLRYRFQVRTRSLNRKEREELYGFTVDHYRRGYAPFNFSGGEYGDIQNPIRVGFGDGSTTDFFLPNDRIINGTVTAYVATVETAVTVTDESGMIQFASPPALDAEVTAKYQCLFRCFMENQGNVIASLNRQTIGIYEVVLTLQEMPNG